MAADSNGKQYVLGKGKVYFDQFLPGTKTATGERYIGNTPELTTSQDEDTLDHYDADEGLNVKDESVTIEQNVTGQMTTDSISVENVAMLFGGDIQRATVAAAVGVTESHPAKLGRWLQLGVSALQPTGARMITNVVVKKGTTAVALPGNFEVDLDLARVYIEADAPDVDADDVLIYTFDQVGTTREVVVGKGTEVRGALRFVSKNPIGKQKDYFWPYVKLSANGDFSLKGDEWQTLPFAFEVLKKDSATARVYIDNRTV